MRRPPTMAIPANKNFKIINALSHLALGVAESEAKNPGAQIKQYAELDSDYQLWQLKPVGVGGQGFYNIENVGSAMSMEVFAASVESGASIAQWPYDNGQTHRQWALVPVAGKEDVYQIKNRHSKLFIDNVDGHTQAPAQVAQYNSWPDWPTDGRQHWKLVPAEKPVVTPTVKVPVVVELFQHPLGYPPDHDFTKNQRSALITTDAKYLKANDTSTPDNPIAGFSSEISAIKIHPGPDYDPRARYEVHFHKQQDFQDSHIIRTLGLGEPNLHFEVDVSDHIHSIKFVTLPPVAIPATTAKVPVVVELFHHPLGYPPDHDFTKNQRSALITSDAKYLKANDTTTPENPIAAFPSEISAIKIHPGPDYDPRMQYEIHCYTEKDFKGSHIIRTLGLGEPNLHFEINVADNIHSIKFVTLPPVVAAS
jgi:Ricin-type beta-trefoil lectin domain-like